MQRNVLTWVANRGLDCITALKKEVHEPRSNVTGRTGDAHDLPRPTAHSLCRNWTLRFRVALPPLYRN